MSHEPAAPSALRHGTTQRSTTLLLTITILGCGVPQDAPEPRGDSSTVPAEPPTPPMPTPSRTAAEELAELDTRRPVPLKPMMAWHQKQQMMEHLVAIQGIVDGVAREDWAAVAAASRMIETSSDMTQMCEHMGAGAPGFTDMALEFHAQADQIGVAANAEDGAAVLQATARTLQNCTGCHAAFRQDVQ